MTDAPLITLTIQTRDPRVAELLRDVATALPAVKRTVWQNDLPGIASAEGPTTPPTDPGDPRK